MDEQDQGAKKTQYPPDFWTWAQDVYARPGVSATLLTLQDTAGLNVNILLWACWAGAHFETAPEIAVRNAIAAAKDWREGVATPLRNVRRFMKEFEGRDGYNGAVELRASVKKSELEAERIEITILDDLSQRILTPADDGDLRQRARRNLAAYASLAGAAQQEAFSTTLLHRLIDNIFDQPQDEVAQKELGGDE